MPVLKRAKLTLEADVDQDGSAETGVFEMVAGDGLSVTPGMRTGFIGSDDGTASTFNAIYANLSEDYGGAFASPSKRRGFFLDLGGGQHSISIEFNGWEGATDSSGDPIQWGNDPQPSRTQSSATGQHPLTQIDVLLRYLTAGQFDSRDPATFEYGEYSTDGLYEPIDVVIEGPQATMSSANPNTFSGSMTLIAAASLEDYYDALANSERGG